MRGLAFVVIACVIGGSDASAMSFSPCRPVVVDVPPHPRVIVEGHDASVVEIYRADEYEPYARRVARTLQPLDADHAQVTLDLGVGERAHVTGFKGPRCSGRVMRVVADWRPDRSAPETPDVAVSSDDQIQIVWEEDRKNAAWWMRLDRAATLEDLASGRHESSIASWIEWIDLAPGERIYLRMVRLLPDGSESAPWQALIERSPGDTIRITPIDVVTHVSPAPTVGASSDRGSRGSDRGSLVVAAILGALFALGLAISRSTAAPPTV